MKALTVLFSLVPFLAFAQTDSLRQEIDCETVFALPEELPEYPLGGEALAASVNEIVRRARCKVAEAKSLAFVVTAEGKIKSPRFLPGELTGCSSALEKELEQLPSWKPGTQAGKPVCVNFVIPIK